MPDELFLVTGGCLLLLIIIVVVVLIVLLTTSNGQNNSQIEIIEIKPPENKQEIQKVKIEQRKVVKIPQPVQEDKIVKENIVAEEITKPVDSIVEIQHKEPESIEERDEYLILFDEISSPKIRSGDDISCQEEVESDWSQSSSWLKRDFKENPINLSQYGNYYLTNYKINEPGIIDIVTYGERKRVHYLYDNNTIRVKNKKYRLKVSGSRSMIGSIVVFNNYLIALAGGALYYLNSQKGNRWRFSRLPIDKFKDIVNIDENIIRVSTTTKGDYISVQTENWLYIFDKHGILRSRIEYSNHCKRVFGSKVDIYADIDIARNVAKMSNSNYIYTSIVDAVVSSNNDLVPITLEKCKEYNIIAVRMIENTAYYITR